MKADTILTYGRDNGNGREAAKLYQIAFSYRRQTRHTTFVAGYRRFDETGSVAKYKIWIKEERDSLGRLINKKTFYRMAGTIQVTLQDIQT